MAAPGAWSAWNAWPFSDDTPHNARSVAGCECSSGCSGLAFGAPLQFDAIGATTTAVIAGSLGTEHGAGPQMLTCPYRERRQQIDVANHPSSLYVRQNPVAPTAQCGWPSGLIDIRRSDIKTAASKTKPAKWMARLVADLNQLGQVRQHSVSGRAPQRMDKLGAVEIHRELMTAEQSWIKAVKL